MLMKKENFKALKKAIKECDVVSGKLPGGDPFFFMRDNAERLVDEICIMKVYEVFRPVKRGDVVIDIGSHIGLFTVTSAKKAKIVVSIEPQKDNFQILKKNISLHKLDNVISMNFALSDSEGDATLYLANHSGGHSLLFMPWSVSRKEVVHTRTLDGIVDELKLDKIDFIKIDAEGAEMHILRGSEDTLKKTSYLSIAAYHDPFQPREIENFLKNRGFDVKVRMISKVESNAMPYVYAEKKVGG